jgi:hypothetical protein
VNPWLGARRGHLSDWTTQQWVRRTGRRVDLYSRGVPRAERARRRLVRARLAAGAFGAPGFYFVVRDERTAWSRTIAAMTEHIHVYLEGDELHADHALRLWGARSCDSTTPCNP